jgi:hypothetical protein
MAASHPHLFHQSIADESEIRKLVKNYFFPGSRYAPVATCDRGGYPDTQYE